jgi:hypothetical protein
MAFEERLELISASTGADLSAAANQYKVVKFDANGAVVAVAAITDIPAGVLYDTAASGRVVPIAVGGIAKVKAGATIAAGAPVATKADGTLQTAATTQYVLGTARLGGVAGDIIPVNISTANLGIKA